MEDNTQKHKDFVSGPMEDKLVTALPGIGEELGQKLAIHGYKKAYKVLAKLLVLEKDAQKFKDWLRDDMGANDEQAYLCHNALWVWCDTFL
ncbi:barrier-to-autointegration factor-like protein [Cololabis saira]|uniref:barrier-to-autointegration factor-like protein n=1 Tax=Cololabis saira TaxID=129043 RepID=UPI002AD4A91C|nr:barrier-to-autointegration factor-like protein [Cololabis saira]